MATQTPGKALARMAFSHRRLDVAITHLGEAMNHRPAQTIGVFLLLVLFGDPAFASSPPASPQDRPATDQEAGQTDRRNQEEETDPAAQGDDTDILLTDESDIVYTGRDRRDRYRDP